MSVTIGDGKKIDEGVTLGYPPERTDDKTLTIGKSARVRSGSVIYLGTSIGDELQTGHNVVIREGNRIGNGLRIWSNSVMDYGCTIGNNVRIHTNVYVCQNSVIEDEVFLAPGACLANDKYPVNFDNLVGPTIRKGARIGMNCTIMPGVVIGAGATVGAGSVVTHDIPDGAVCYGNPARVVKK